jgi:N-acetylglucosaminyldiphosphoundecaprenol N-acetyl-beta-D-mannosaminyltransferase
MNRQSSSTDVDVLGIAVDPLHMASALGRVAEEVSARRSGYVCLVNVHGVMEAQRDARLAQTYALASIRVPDGAPISWVGRWQGFTRMRRVAGPDLMLEIFKGDAFRGCTHFLYGGKEGIAEELRQTLTQRFPWVNIVGTYTPPFRDLTRDEEDSLAARIRELKPNIMWVGISTPKQEAFMRRFLPLLDHTLMFGVGAAFDFHTGHVLDSPEWMKRAGLQWLHRLIQEPRRLFWRYLRTNPAFLWHIAMQLSHLRAYPPVAKSQLYEAATAPSGKR